MTLRFASFLMGGFECASHVRQDRTRLDLLQSTHHDECAEIDYRLLQSMGVYTARDGIRWHRIESQQGIYDWKSCTQMVDAAHATGMEVIWDLCHWGVPDWVDPFAPEFPTQFAAFAKAFAEWMAEKRTRANIVSIPFFCPMNEISFWSWVGGDTEYFAPFGCRRGPQLKRQLVHATILATKAVREILPQARFVQAEPLIRVTSKTRRMATLSRVAAHNEGQFEAWDMIAGRKAPELGGAEDLLDVLGINYYWNNQWIHGGARTPLGHMKHTALHMQLMQIQQRYQRPLLLSETGAEADSAPGWLGMVCAEVRQANVHGANVCGICLYPVTDYPGWDDNRHVATGLLRLDRRYRKRYVRTTLLDELSLQQSFFNDARRIERDGAS